MLFSEKAERLYVSALEDETPAKAINNYSERIGTDLGTKEFAVMDT